jgi:hypothetical protein
MTALQTSLTFQCKVHFTQARRGRKQMAMGDAPVPSVVPLGRVPRIARLMALAIRFEGLVERGEVVDYAELARLGYVTRARVTQIMNLLNLAPDIQEAILFLPAVEAGHDLIREWQARPIAAEAVWVRQRRIWKKLIARGVRFVSPA